MRLAAVGTRRLGYGVDRNRQESRIPEAWSNDTGHMNRTIEGKRNSAIEAMKL